MKAQTKNIPSILVIATIFSLFIDISALGSGNADLTKLILDKMNENRGKIANFKCINEKLIYNSKEKLKELRKSDIDKGLPESVANGLLEKVYTYQKDYLALDKNYSGRVEIISEQADSKGNLIGERLEKKISTWDTKNTIKYYERPTLTSATIGGTEQPIELSNRYAQPWKLLGGDFSSMLLKALEKNEKVNVEKQKDGKYRIEFLNPLGRKITGVIDPNQGYSVVLQEKYNDGKLQETRNAKYEKVQSGIWFPVSGEYIEFNPDTQVIMLKNTMKIKEIKINDPNFYDNLYHVDLPKGTRVNDLATGLSYVVGDPMNVTMDGLGQSLKNIADKTLININNHEEIEQKTDLWVPIVSIAIDKCESFVFNFSDSKLVNPQRKLESEEANKFLSELGKGDVAWDGTIIATRGTKIFTTKQESKQPLKLTEGRWTNSYKLPEKVELPYSMLAISKDNDNYLVNISKIEPGGIWINYRKLSSEEISSYKQDETKK